jgi:hypothetical protein
MESRESQRDKRVQDVINGRPSGGGNSPSASAMRAREEIQGIEAERAANLERQKIIGNTRQQQLATMKQASLLGASGMAAADGGARVSPVAQQAAAMNPQTQAILQKYGVKPGPRTTTSTVQQSGPNIRTTNTTNNNVRNEIKIVQPQIPMRQQQIAVAGQGKSGNLDKFKAWLDSSFAKQANEYEIQQKEYRRREWNLARNSQKLFQKLNESTRSLGEKMDPKNMGTTFGGQLKTLLFLFLATTIDKWWNPLMKKIESFEAGFRAVFGLPINADLKKSGANGISFVNKIKEFIGIDTRSEKGKNTSLLEGFKNVFTDGIDRLIATLKLFVEDRRLALQKINLPDFKMPSTDFNPLGNMINSAFKGVMAPATEYLGNILSALMGGSSAVAKRAASNLTSSAKNDFKKSFGGRYFTSNSTDFMGNLKDDSTYGMSMMMSHNLSDRSNKLHTGGLMTGMKMLEGNAKRSGGAVINPDLLRQLGFGDSTIFNMIQSGQAEYVPMKLIKVSKSEAERNEYSGGSASSYIGNEILDNMTFGIYGKLTGWGAKKAAMKSFQAARAANKAGLGRTYGALRGAGRAAKVVGKAAGPLGWGLTLGTGIAEGIGDYMEANEGNSNFVYKAVPLSDKRPGEQIRLLRVTPEGFNTLKKAANVKSFDASDISFQRWIEGVERSRKAIMNVKGKLEYSNPNMKVLNQANTIKANYDAKMDKIWNDPNYTGRGGVGNFVSTRDNTARSIANGLSWAANGLNDIKYRMTGSISPLHIPAGEARRNAERGIKYLMDKYGLSKEAAAGIAGVIQKESGWNPGAQNQQEKAKGYKGFGRGLCQWSNNWGIKDFPEWYYKNFGERKYPDEVPLEHQLDYLMTGLGEDGIRKEEFLKIIHKPGVTVEEATKAMLLGYENGGKHLASFTALAGVKAYGGVSGVNKMYADRASAALGFYNILGGTDGTGFNQTSSGTYTFDEDAIDNGQSGLWNVKYSMTAGAGGVGWDMSGLQLADAEDIKATIIGQEITDSLKLGDWFVGRSIKYLASNAFKKSTGYCARHVRLALKAGGINDSNHPAAATDYLHYLPKRGFARIQGGIQLQAGDICILPAGGSHRYGHICMFTGKTWVSDFIQPNGMNVYGKGWPCILFRYTGKGGSGSDTLIDAAQNYVEPILDGARKVMEKGAEILGKTSDFINPETDREFANRVNPDSLNYAQRATYEWARKLEGVKEDQTGLYMDDTKNNYRHYIDLNSGISRTGLITQANIQGTYILKDGRAFEPVNNTVESDIAQNSLLSSIAGKISGFNSTGRVLDYQLPGTYGYVGGKRRPYNIRYNLYEIAGDGSGYNTVLVPHIPMLTDSGLTVGDMAGNITDPVEYEQTGTPKKGWQVLYSREFKIKSDISGTMKNYEWSPYLHGDLKIGIDEKAMDLILGILRMIRGEQEMSKELSGKIGDIKDKVLEEGSKFLRSNLNINENSIKESIKLHKSGKDKDRFKEDANGNIIDTKLGIEIYQGGPINPGYIDPKKFLELTPDLSGHINENLLKLSALNGSETVTAESSFERYKSLYGNNVFKDKGGLEKLKKSLAGRDLGYSVSFEKSIGGFGDYLIRNALDKGKFKALLGEDGEQKFILDKETWKDKNGNNLNIQNLRSQLKNAVKRENGETDEKFKDRVESLFKKLMNTGLTEKELDKLGIKIDGKKNIDWSNLESILRSAPGLKRDQVISAVEDASIKMGLEKLFSNEENSNIRKSFIDKYNKIIKETKEGSERTNRLAKEGFSEENGFLVHTSKETGRKEAFGTKTSEGKAEGIKDSETYADANSGFIKDPSKKAKEFDFRDKLSWFAYKFGAKPMGSTGRMYIQVGDGSRFVFNANEISPAATLDDIINSGKGKFFDKTENNNGDTEYFDGGNWRQAITGAEARAAFGPDGAQAYEKDYQNKLKKLRESQATWNSEENEEIRKKSFFDLYKAKDLEKRLAGLSLGGVEASNSLLEDMVDIEGNQVDLLGIIAKNTAGDNLKGLEGRIDELTGLRTINEEKRDRERKASIRDLWYQTLAEYGKGKKTYEEGQVAFHDAKKYLKERFDFTDKDIYEATGVRAYGKYSFKKMISQQQTAEAKAAENKENKDKSNNIKSDKKNIEEKGRLQAIEANIVDTESKVADQNKANAESFKNTLDQANIFIDDLRRLTTEINKLTSLNAGNKIENSGNYNISQGGNTYITHKTTIGWPSPSLKWGLGQPAETKSNGGVGNG